MCSNVVISLVSHIFLCVTNSDFRGMLTNVQCHGNGVYTNGVDKLMVFWVLREPSVPPSEHSKARTGYAI